MSEMTDAELATRINDIVTKWAYIDSRMTNAEVQVFNEAARRLASLSQESVEPEGDLMDCPTCGQSYYRQRKERGA